MRATILITLSAFLTASCATSPIFTPITDSLARFEIVGAKFKAPSGTGWYLLNDYISNPYIEQFAKEAEGQNIVDQSGRRGHTYMVAIQSFKNDSGLNFTSQAELGEFVERTFTGNSNPERFKTLDKGWDAANLNDAVCIRWHENFQDFNHPIWPDRLFIKKEISITCIHPKNSNYVIKAMLIESRPEEESPWDYLDEVEVFWDSIEFTSVGS